MAASSLRLAQLITSDADTLPFEAELAQILGRVEGQLRPGDVVPTLGMQLRTLAATNWLGADCLSISCHRCAGLELLLVSHSITSSKRLFAFGVWRRCGGAW